MIARFLFLLGLFIAINSCAGPPAVESGRELSVSVDEAANSGPADSQAETININTATSDELQRLPHIGASTAQKIIEHRETYGPFNRPEELMQIQGISDVRFRRIRHLIRVK